MTIVPDQGNTSPAPDSNGSSGLFIGVLRAATPVVSRGIPGRKSEPLDPEAERAVLSAAAWLVEREFDAEVRVLAAEEAPDDVAAKAEPGRPAIDIEE